MQNTPKPVVPVKTTTNSESTKDDATQNTRRNFVSAQRRYDNIRVRDSEMPGRLCLECGMYIRGERKYQEHIVAHEGAYLVYQLYYSGQSGGTSTSSNQPQQQGKGTPAANTKKRKRSEGGGDGGGGGADTKQKTRNNNNNAGGGGS